MKNKYMMAKETELRNEYDNTKGVTKNFLCNDETVLYLYCNTTKIYTWDQATEN